MPYPRHEFLLVADHLCLSVHEIERATHAEFRQSQKAFIERGLISSAAAKKSGKYISAAAMLTKLDRRLEKARKERGLTR